MMRKAGDDDCICVPFQGSDMQRARIQTNDLNDIMSLSIAIPYSDVVVTETMWQTAIIQTEINRLRQTRVLRSVKELPPILEPN